MYRILLVDDDPHIQTTNEAYLKKQGYQVYRADDGHSALALIQTAELDAIVLDVDMPGLDGVTLCRRLRETSSVPVIFLSAYAKTDDRIRGLMAGGDDYLGKPYSLVELELRLRLRIQGRQNVLSSAVLCFDELEIDLGLREVRYNGERISFPPLEFELLAFLAQNPRQVFSYEQLYDHVWKSPLNRGLHNMQVCMARVRQKLKRICPKRQYIETIRQKGYLFRGEPETN
ncbi:MAG TPA: response regulator transcription factor [Candidatus Caccousia stercoris]|uniref:Stage 0 sporulation protein A homolog n=1 Tax=Candidatus Caccousia stercoris TaxID=2840723 RepID=A0A9D1K2S1_9FIRM|nr:response regulator transcription factor [Candidatus Caccousia stercoris]